jgi:hypothetical protein
MSKAECDDENIKSDSALKFQKFKQESAKMSKLETFNDKNASFWFIDSGASSHMCSSKESFINIDYSIKGKVSIADGKTMDYVGMGTVKLELFIENEILKTELKDVLYIPSLDENLMSVKKLTDNGFTVKFSGNKCYLSKDKNEIEIGFWTNGGLCKVHTVENCYRSSESQKLCIHDWHLRLDHRNLDDISSMQGKGLEIKKCKCSDICESCIMGKMKTLKFPKQSSEVENILDCVSTDVCGPLHIPSLGGSRYFVIFQDDHSRYCEIYFMKNKSEVFSNLVKFVKMAENFTKKKLKYLKSDNGKEFKNNKILNFLNKNGIKFQHTVAHASQQNGKPERKHLTIMDAVRTMLIHSKLPKRLWAEAALNAVYTQNRLIHSTTGKIPYEVFFGTSIKVFDFHEFGSSCFHMIPKQNRRKLDNRAARMKFVGYDYNSKGYRLYDENKRKIIISRNVKFIQDSSSSDKSQNIVEKSKTIVPKKEITQIEIENTELISPSDELEIEEEQNMEKEDEEIEENDLEFDTTSNESNTSNGQSSISLLNVQDENIDDHNESNENNDVQEEPRRSTRIKNVIDRFISYTSFKCATNKYFQPSTLKQALNCPDSEKWQLAMQEELTSLKKNETWSPANLPDDREAIGCKWVYQLKLDENNNIVKYKARLVAQGFKQKEGIDYDEVFAPVARTTSLRLLLSIAGIKKYIVTHIDVKSAFLNGKLDEVIYMKQPPGFENGNFVLKLNKSLYGLKQAAHIWNNELNKVLTELGFVSCMDDPCLYKYEKNSNICYILVHVDDMMIVANDSKINKFVTNKIATKFEITKLGNIRHYLGLNVERDSSGNFMISQFHYIDKILMESKMENAKPSKYPLSPNYYKEWAIDDKFLPNNEEYRKLIGMISFLANNSRPDIATAVNILSQRNEKPKQIDWNELKRMIRYLKSTKYHKLQLSFNSRKDEFKIFSDANWAEDCENRKSNSGYACLTNGGVISWRCKKQDTVTLSSTEAEYVALSETAKEGIWLTRLREFFNYKEEYMKILTDSESSRAMMTGIKVKNRTKHIDTRYHFTRDLVMKKKAKLFYVSTEMNVADMFTKPLGPLRLSKLKSLIGMRSDEIEDSN